jgi:hypothetical protein
MAIKRITPEKQIMRYMDGEISAREQVIIRRLQYVGEQCVAQARDHGSYQDQTGNLRSSVGYVIVRNGVILSGSNFDTVRGGSQGQSEGRKFVQEIAAKFNKGIALIVVAGMEYAGYVEAKGYDVLTSSEMLAQREVPRLLSKLGFEKV